MSTAVLNVKIDKALKEKFRHCVKVHSENLSVATERLLPIAFIAIGEAGVSAEDIDSQYTEGSVVEALTLKEIKALYRLLKKEKWNNSRPQSPVITTKPVTYYTSVM